MGSEMCIRDRPSAGEAPARGAGAGRAGARMTYEHSSMYFATLIVTEPTVHNLGTALDRDITTELAAYSW